MTEIIYQWIDVLWLPVAWLTLHKHQRLKGLIFTGACIVTLRTQIELMESIGYPRGFVNITDMPLYHRGLIVYGLFITLFLVLAYFSPRSQKIVIFAASISLYITALVISMLTMVL